LRQQQGQGLHLYAYLFAGEKMTREDINKHESKFVREPMSGCWLWIAGADKHGYGMLWDGKKMDRAHRLFYASNFGIDVKGLDVLHDCDNPSCVNPHHLHTGDQAQNMKEKAIRGRSGKKLNAVLANKIKGQIALNIPQRKIAQMFGVSQKIIHSINKGLIWNVNK
jgi:hypothetical protein